MASFAVLCLDCETTRGATLDDDVASPSEEVRPSCGGDSFELV